MWCVERLLRARPRPAPAPACALPCLANVLTPHSIPEFCIPPRLLAAPSPAPGPARRPEAPDPTDWDPRSQAALSLPHLPRRPTSYGFCALLESPNTRRKESLLLGGSAALLPGGSAALLPGGSAALLPRPRAHTYGGGGEASRDPPSAPPPRSRWRCRRLLRAPDALLGRPRARARSASSADEDSEDSDVGAARRDAPAPVPAPAPGGGRCVALGRDGALLHLAADYCPASRRLRVRLLRAEGLRGGCRVSLALVPPGKTRKRRGAAGPRGRDPGCAQDFFFEGLSEDALRRAELRVKAQKEGRGPERGRLLGRGQLALSSLLL